MNTDLNLVTLCDGRQGLRAGLHVKISEPAARHGEEKNEKGEASQAEVKSENAEPSGGHRTVRPAKEREETALPVLDFVASDETLDRCDEVISASGWRLDTYRRN